jgi:hypothetical protein
MDRDGGFWERQAAASGLRVFPVRITWTGEKWDKVPLIKDWVERANYHELTRFDWSTCNGYGCLMGKGYYALDIDSYKPSAEVEAWLAARYLPPTRTHRTVSGGRHLIFMTLSSQRDLPTRAHIVPGLDSRGLGGFVAFGEGYEVLDDRAPSILPPEVGDELARSAGGGLAPAGERAFVEGYRPPEPVGAAGALLRALVRGRVLRLRWDGTTTGLQDTSRSGLDHSVARLLALGGLDEDQIVWALLERFEHGAARWKDDGHTAVRAAARSALKAIARRREDEAMVRDWKQPEMSAADEAELRRALFGQ